MTTKNKKKVITFNKKNTLALADKIYSDKDGVISCLKLCHGLLVNGKEGKRTTHCAVGEAYFTFVNPDMKKVDNTDDPTDEAINALLKKAQLRNKRNAAKLAQALDSAVRANDNDGASDSVECFLVRSQRVAEVFRKEVAPLLK